MHAYASLTVLVTVFSFAGYKIQLKIVMKRSLLALPSLKASAHFVEKIQMTLGIFYVTPLKSVA